VKAGTVFLRGGSLAPAAAAYEHGFGTVLVFGEAPRLEISWRF